MAKKPKQVGVIFDYNENVSQLLTEAIALYESVAGANQISAGSPAGAGSVYVAFTNTQITSFLNHVAAARTAESAATLRTTGAAPARNNALAPVIVDIQTVVLAVKSVVINTPNVTLATTIVTACTLHTHKVTIKTKAAFEAHNDKTTAGEIDFVYKAVKSGLRACYVNWISIDNINWTIAKITPDSSTTFVHGHPSGTKIYLKGQIILSDKKGGAQAFIIPPVAYIYVL